MFSPYAFLAVSKYKSGIKVSCMGLNTHVIQHGGSLKGGHFQSKLMRAHVIRLSLS